MPSNEIGGNGYPRDERERDTMEGVPWVPSIAPSLGAFHRSFPMRGTMEGSSIVCGTRWKAGALGAFRRALPGR